MPRQGMRWSGRNGRGHSKLDVRDGLTHHVNKFAVFLRATSTLCLFELVAAVDLRGEKRDVGENNCECLEENCGICFQSQLVS